MVSFCIFDIFQSQSDQYIIQQHKCIGRPFDPQAFTTNQFGLVLETNMADTVEEPCQTVKEEKPEDSQEVPVEASAATAVSAVPEDSKEVPPADVPQDTAMETMETKEADENLHQLVPLVECAKCGEKVPKTAGQARSATTFWCNSCNSVMKTLRTNLSWPPYCFEGLPEVAKKEFFMSVKSLKDREKELKYGKIRDVLLKSVSTSRTEELIKQKGGTFWPLSVYAKNLVCHRFFPQIAIAMGVLTSNRGEGDEPLWRTGRGTSAIAGCSGRGAIAWCHCRVPL